MEWPSLEPLTPYRELISGIPEDDFVDLRGQRIYAPVYGDGPTIVLLHGFAADSYFYRKLIPLLVGRFRIIAVDLKGFGLTERPGGPEEYSLEHQADVIVEVAQCQGSESFHLVGHSYGSAVAARLALRSPEFVLSLVLMAPVWEFRRAPWYLRNRFSAESLHVLTRALLSDPEKFRKATRRAFHPDHKQAEEASEWYRKHILVEGFRSALFGYARTVAGGSIREIEYPALQLPTMILAGRNDQLAPLKSCEKLAETMPGARFEVMDDCGHSLPEEKPGEVAEILIDFYDSVQ